MCLILIINNINIQITHTQNTHKTHKNKKKGESKSKVALFFEFKYAPFLMRKPVKVIVLLFFIALFGAGIFGVTQLKMGFEAFQVLPDDTYLTGFIDTNNEYFRAYANGAFVVIGAVDYTQSGVDEQFTEMGKQIARGIEQNIYTEKWDFLVFCV